MSAPILIFVAVENRVVVNPKGEAHEDQNILMSHQARSLITTLLPQTRALIARVTLEMKSQKMSDSVATFFIRKCHGSAARREREEISATGTNSG